MSPSTTTTPAPGERDAQAGEYALGLLEGAELAVFERRIEVEAGLAAAVESWRAHFAAIDATAPLIAPPLALWPRIEASVAGILPAAERGRRKAVKAGGTLADWWGSLPIWRGMALAGALAAIVLAVGLAAALDRARRQPVMVAVLLTDASVAAAVVHTFADGRVEMLPLQSIDVPQGKALEIWTLWDRAVGPRSVGLIDRARTTPLRLDQLPLGSGQLFEITIEDAKGSPSGRPTGPIVAKGTTSQTL